MGIERNNMLLKEIIELKCKRCDHSWVPRMREVRICPKCKSARWDQKPTTKKKEQK